MVGGGTQGDDVLSTQQARVWSSLVPISPGGTRTPLFYIGSYLLDVGELALLGDELKPDQPLYGLQPRGLDGTEPPFQRIEDMADFYISEIRSVQPHGPYLVGGHSSGSLVAFEIARQLEAAGDEVAGVLLVDKGPPGMAPPVTSKWQYVVRRMKFFKSQGRLWHAIAWQLKLVFDRLVVRRVGRDADRIMAAIHEAHYHAHSVYQGGDVTCDLVLIRCEETIATGDRSWYLRWQERTSGTLHVTAPVPGAHSGLLEQPNVQMLAETMREAIGVLTGPKGVGRLDE